MKVGDGSVGKQLGRHAVKYVFCIPVALFVVKTVYKACCRL